MTKQASGLQEEDKLTSADCGDLQQFVVWGPHYINIRAFQNLSISFHTTIMTGVHQTNTKMMRQVFFLLLVLMSVRAFLRKPKVRPEPYGQFKNFTKKHIIKKPMHVNECFNMLKTKNINSENRKCKKTNTFMEATVQDVIDVCKNGERIQVQNESMQKSRKLFRLTVCSVSQPGQFPHCKYKGEIKEAKVVIRCTDVNLPVHFHDEADYHDSGQHLGTDTESHEDLLGVLAAARSNSSAGTNFQAFRYKHENPTMTVNQCDNEIYNRHIVGDDGGCRPIHTFIKADIQHIIPVCNEAGISQGGNLMKSTTPFPVVVCRPTGTYPNCGYQGQAKTQYIIIACVGGLPVHFQTGTS
ncbi:hypothetical protein WMY93_009531 [Mugilogobius chulae]|uniref:Ribonuclease A-domain domain-containing protein n=1 Tax=Mugilogobius chulae TaxID=88201 RepID=A0AAW0PI89_9GOBI